MDEDKAQPYLPDILRERLNVVFIGINPSIFSAAAGHYFARKTNRFWPAFSHSLLSREAREALGVSVFGPAHDRLLLDHGFGFTDAVKRPTARANDLTSAEFDAGAPFLIEKLERYRPNVACFHGVTAYRKIHRALAAPESAMNLGPQSLRLGGARVFVVPNPSAANGHSSPADQTVWYDRLASFLATST